MLKISLDNEMQKYRQAKKAKISLEKKVVRPMNGLKLINKICSATADISYSDRINYRMILWKTFCRNH